MRTLFQHISAFLADKGIKEVGLLPFSECTVIHPALLERSIAEPKSAILFLVPYFTGDTPERNLSLYAVSRDYHLFMAELFRELLTFLSARRPDGTFACFADHSPIDERTAAAKCGLGVLGENRLLISPIYGSYVFIGEILTDLSEDRLPAPIEPSPCLKCGRCAEVCPLPGECLSALTQKKGELLPSEQALLRNSETAWGCDLCQTCCPMNEGVSPTPIPFFHEKRIFRLTPSQLASMDKAQFSERAYAWRGRKTIERNLSVLFSDTDSNEN